MTERKRFPHVSHWGAFDAEVEDGKLVDIHPFAGDPAPSRLLDNIRNSVHHPARVAEPMVRKGWLENGPGPSDSRGIDPFVPVSWDTAIDLLSNELRRVYGEFGAEAVYGGSYGWASAGRFHHAQSQVHRFLNSLGGYTKSVDTYSTAAGSVILRRVLAPASVWQFQGTHWKILSAETDMFICFGGLPAKNMEVSSGGLFRHRNDQYIKQAADRGAEFVYFSPIRDDIDTTINAEWVPVSPGTDTAAMFAIGYVLASEHLVDRPFLERYCVGYEHLERYLLGLDDDEPKTPEWAEARTGISADRLRTLAHRMAAAKQVFINTTWSLQRSEYGEQPIWMAVALAAMLGQIGLPGGGYGFGYGSVQRVGESVGALLPLFSQGQNPVSTFIPVARFADMLLNPGEPFVYDRGTYEFPETRLVYWAGGNPFHHHQQLGKLRRALQRPDTIVVHEPYWTAMARHADFVMPSTVTLERNDIGASRNEAWLTAMPAAVEPFGLARNDYDIFADLSEELGTFEQFTERRTEMQWLSHMYDTWRGLMAHDGYDYPEFDRFWQVGRLELPVDENEVLFADFRQDPETNPLGTATGKIELYSELIASFGYDDCPGHPVWLPSKEALDSPLAAKYPLLMIANNPRSRLHSQLDMGNYSQESKIHGREPVRIHPDDASPREIHDGDIVFIRNERGGILAGAVISDQVQPGIIQISTGAWYQPLDPVDPESICVHGNPNTITRDLGASSLSQGAIGQHTLVEIERWNDALPPITVHQPPLIERRS